MEEFWAKVRTVNDATSCWEWVAGTRSSGYGVFRDFYAHRFSYELANGPIPKGLFICHKCDNPRCVRPSHLYAGTAKQNSHDMWSRKRRGPHNKLFWRTEKVAELYEQHKLTQKQIAEKLGCSQTAVSYILRKLGVKTAKHNALTLKLVTHDVYRRFHAREATAKQLAMEVGCDITTIYDHLRSPRSYDLAPRPCKTGSASPTV